MSEQVANMIMTGPIPGESLVNDPENPAPFETPPEITTYEAGVEYLAERILNPTQIGKVIEMVTEGFPLGELAGAICMKGFMDGKWTPDLLLLLLEPTIYMLMFVCEMAQVPYVLSNDQAMKIGPDDELTIKQALNQKTKSVEKSKLASVLPSDVIARGTQAMKELEISPEGGGGLLSAPAPEGMGGEV